MKKEIRPYWVNVRVSENERELLKRLSNELGKKEADTVRTLLRIAGDVLLKSEKHEQDENKS